MYVYGADYSGARDPSNKIYYARCRLDRKQITVEKIVKCDDRLDLYDAIVSSNAPWGLDFPFALPKAGYRALKLPGWTELLDYATNSERDQFLNSPLIQLSCESKYSNESLRDCWRETDIAVDSFSPLKRNNPNMLSMTYGGLKLLAYLRKQGVKVFPFDNLDKSHSRVYEVYPSNTWAFLGQARSFTNLPVILAGVSSVQYRVGLSIPNQDAADAVIAAVTLAACIREFRLEDDWSKFPPCWREEEWNARNLEGVIVRPWCGKHDS